MKTLYNIKMLYMTDISYFRIVAEHKKKIVMLPFIGYFQSLTPYFCIKGKLLDNAFTVIPIVYEKKKTKKKHKRK